MGTDLLVSMVSVMALTAAFEREPEMPPVKPVAKVAQAAQLLPVEQNLIDKTNAERARYGLRPLVVSPQLMESSRRHCQWMASVHSLTHSSGVAENIAMGQPNSDAAISAWMNSSGHRANMLGGYTRVGAAGYVTSNGTIYWCIQFAR